MAGNVIMINRAPVLTLWGAVVAQRLGFDRAASLTLGKALAGLSAQAKGRRLGIYQPGKQGHEGPPKKVGLGEDFWVEICGRPIPAKNTQDGVRAVVKDKPIEPESVERYLGQKFGDELASVQEAMASLANALEPEILAEQAYGLYERFRPEIPGGRRGWGAKGELDLSLIASLAANV